MSATATFGLMVLSKIHREQTEIERMKLELTDAERATLSGLRDGTLVAVPREPTEAMLQNTVDAAGTIRVLDFTTPAERAEPFLIARFTYRAMLAAAPEAPGRGDKP